VGVPTNGTQAPSPRDLSFLPPPAFASLPPLAEGVPATKEPGRVGGTHQRHLISQPERPLPPTSTRLRISPSGCGGSAGDEGAGEGGGYPPTAFKLPAPETSPSYLHPPIRRVQGPSSQAGGQLGSSPLAISLGGRPPLQLFRWATQYEPDRVDPYCGEDYANH